MKMTLNRQQVNLVSNLLKKNWLIKNVQVKLNSNWRHIYAVLEEGEINEAKTHLCFDSKSLPLLREAAKRSCGYDLYLEDIEGNRLTVAAHSSQEKLANESPELGYILAKFPSHTQYCLPESCALRLPIALVQAHCVDAKIDSIVIVENLDVFDCWHQAIVPEILMRSLVIYRGKSLHVFLKGLPKIDKMIVFPDLDPAGLQIAFTVPNVTDILIPNELANLLLLEHVNSKNDFYSQSKQMKFLMGNDLLNWNFIKAFIHHNKVSIKQQHFLAHRIALSIYSKW